MPRKRCRRIGIAGFSRRHSLLDPNPMSDLIHLELTDRQRELLLRGLRYVRSSRMLEIRDVPDTVAEERADELSEIRNLVSMLDQNTGTAAATAR